MFINEPFGGLIPGAQGAVLQVLLRTGTPFTGRQIQRMTDGKHSLTAVQSALRTLIALGLVDTMPAGRATLHSLNREHVAVPGLQQLVDPRELLRQVVHEVVNDDPDVITVVLFGSAARGEATRESDIDLAVLTANSVEWERRPDLQSAVERKFGGLCDTLVFGINEFGKLAESKEEPVVHTIIRDRFTLYGDPIPWRTVRYSRLLKG
jgi:predicted nucleotidyltransferase